MIRKSEETMGWVTSVVVHVAVSLILLFSWIELKPFELDFTPIQFAPMLGGEVTGGSPTRTTRVSGPVVDLPKRQTVDETSPLMRLPDSERPIVAAPVPDERPQLTLEESMRPGRRVDFQPSLSDVRERAPTRAIPLSEDVLMGQRTDALAEKLSGDDMFSISWDGPSRVKTVGEMPTFPEDVRFSATIRLEIMVSPEGNVVSVTPITKGLPEYEKASIDAVRTWRFNRLDQTVGAADQRGEITFIFQLK